MHGVPAAAGLLFAIGALSGLLVVSMNTLLQRRGLALAHAGQGIAVQKTCSESFASLVGLAVYGAMLLGHAALLTTVVIMGAVAVLAILATVRLKTG